MVPVKLLNLIVSRNVKISIFQKKKKKNLFFRRLNLIKKKLKISKLKILNKSTLFIKTDKIVNGKLVNELNVLSPVQICRKTVWSLLLTTTQATTPMG